MDIHGVILVCGYEFTLANEDFLEAARNYGTPQRAYATDCNEKEAYAAIKRLGLEPFEWYMYADAKHMTFTSRKEALKMQSFLRAFDLASGEELQIQVSGARAEFIIANASNNEA